MDVMEAPARIEALLADADPASRSRMEEIVRQLMSLYGQTLQQMMDALSPEARQQLGRDPLVSSVLLIHGLHPISLRTRVEQALDQVRPALRSHRGDVTLISVEDDVVRLRLEGACHGCPSSALTMKLAVERAIEDAAPDARGIEVEGLAVPAKGGPECPI